MFSLITRLQKTGGTFSSALMVAAVIIALLSHIQLWYAGVWNGAISATTEHVDARAALRTGRRFGGAPGKPKENVRLKFDLDADLAPLFNWNTKQVFAYLTLDYGGKRSDISNSLVIWDAIIRDEEHAKLELRNARSKYSVWDLGDSFDNCHANITLRWNVQPHVGFLAHGSSPAGGLLLPSPEN